ncbi:hypothetical protein KI688_012960 [Linnemannia hyalina]|uniref:Arm-like repeat domain-containing protein n=1 Tax=Linnemannia hyalina TaxID=64524 RepID=A0A9P7XVP1_9FUNG|nr:hypothetical protein KI688_012960 [Linnemannia hyalina]
MNSHSLYQLDDHVPGKESTNTARRTAQSLKHQALSGQSNQSCVASHEDWLRMDAFPENVANPAVKTVLPGLQERIERTAQLLYCNMLLLQDSDVSSLFDAGKTNTADDLANAPQAHTLDKAEQKWLTEVKGDPIELDRMQWLVIKMVEEFIADSTKDSTKVAEIVALGPALQREPYRKLLSAFIRDFDDSRILDVNLLQGLVQLVQSASPGYLVSDDLIKVLSLLRTHLEDTHQHSSEHLCHLTLAVSMIFDIMADHKVKDLDRVIEHEPLSAVLSGLRDSSDPYLMYQACYAFQALQYVPDDETVLQAVLRHSTGVVDGLVKVTGVFKLDLGSVLEGLEKLQEVAVSAIGVAATVYDGVRSLRESGRGVLESLKEGFGSGQKRPWYPAIRAAYAFVQAGQLKDLKQLIYEAPCRQDPLFQWGICQLLGEITVDTVWSIAIHQQAIDLLGHLYKEDQEWGHDESVKTWMVTILGTLGSSSDESISKSANDLLQEFDLDNTPRTQRPYPLRSHLPIPDSSPILAKVQSIPYMDLFQEAVIAPFSTEQIKDYVEQYVPLEPKTWRTEDYMDKLTTIPNLMDLVRNPFLLSLALEALPGVIEGKQDLSTIKITRVQLYDTFVEHWSNVNKRRLQSNTLSMADRIVFDELLDMGFVSKSIEYSTRLALAIFEKQDGNPIVQYVHDKNSWKAQFFGQDAEVRILRDSSPLTRTGNLHRFLHRSMLEYFLSRAIFDPSKRQDHGESTQQTDSALSDDQLIDTDGPLFTRNLLIEPSVVQFLSDRVKQVTWFKRHLLAVVELSKSDAQASQAAANAITILIRAGVRFNGVDLRGVRIPGADLSGGQFDSAQLQHADLAGVNLSKAWIRQADLSRAFMDGTRFGELPYLEALKKVWSCAFSPDAKFLAAGLGNGNINIYDTATWTRIQTARLWNSETGSTDFILEGHSDRVTAVAFSPTGQQVASASDDKSVRLWDARTGAAVFVLTNSAGRVTSIAYSPNGITIATSWNKMIRIFDTLSGLLVLETCKGGDRIMCLTYSLDDQRIATGSLKGQLQLWEAAATTLGPKRTWTAHMEEIASIAFSPDDRWIASCSRDRTVKLWESHSGALISSFVNHTGFVNCIRFSPSGWYIASASDDKTLRLWELNSLSLGLDSYDLPDPQGCATYSLDGRQLITGSQQKPMRQLNADSGDVDFVFPDHLHNVNCIAFSPDGLQIAIGGVAQEVTLWSVESRAVSFVLRGHKSRVNTVDFSPCGRWLASGSEGSEVRLWNTRSGAGGRVLIGHSGWVQSVAFSPDGCWIASACMEGKVLLWEAGTGELKADKAIDIGCLRRNYVAYMPGCLQVASCHGDGAIRLWDDEQQLQGFRYILKQDQECYKFAFSSCGQWVATTHSTSVRLWRLLSSYQDREALPLQDQDCMSTIEGFTEAVNDIVWRPNKLEFATTSAEGSIRAWRVVEDSNGSGRVSIRLLWSSGPAVLVASGVILNDVIGLGAMNRMLLVQRSATGPASSD